MMNKLLIATAILTFSPSSFAGDNVMTIYGAQNWGELTIVKDASKVGGTAQEVKGVQVDVGLKCHQDGYRVQQIGAVTFPRTKTEERLVVDSNFLKAGQKCSGGGLLIEICRSYYGAIEKAVGACNSGRAAVQLPLTVVGKCGKKTSGIVIGPDEISATANVTGYFELKCEGFPIAYSRHGKSDKFVSVKTQWNGTKLDNMLNELLGGHFGYTPVRMEAMLFTKQEPGTVPLTVWIEKTTGESLSTTKAPPTNNYGNPRVQGYLYPTFNQAAGATLPLKQFFSSARGDRFLLAMPESEAAAKGAGYAYVAVEGYASPIW